MPKITQKRINKSNRSDVKSMAKDLKSATAIDALALSEGGKILLQGLRKDIIGAVDNLCVNHPTMTLQEFVSVCAGMKEKLDMSRVFTNAPKNKAYLVKILGEALAEENSEDGENDE